MDVQEPPARPFGLVRAHGQKLTTARALIGRPDDLRCFAFVEKFKSYPARRTPQKRISKSTSTSLGTPAADNVTPAAARAASFLGVTLSKQDVVLSLAGEKRRDQCDERQKD